MLNFAIWTSSEKMWWIQTLQQGARSYKKWDKIKSFKREQESFLLGEFYSVDEFMLLTACGLHEYASLISCHTYLF
jgi:hypothetical protein